MGTFSEEEALIDSLSEYELFLKIQELTIVRSINMYNTKNDKIKFYNCELNDYIDKCIKATSKFGVVFNLDGSSNYVEWYDKWRNYALSRGEGFTYKMRR